MNIPINSKTICGKIANKITGINFNSANIHKIAYIIITIPKRSKNLLR